MKIGIRGDFPHDSKGSINFQAHLEYEVTKALTQHLVDKKFIDLKTQVLNAGTYNEVLQYSAELNVLREANVIQINEYLNMIGSSSPTVDNYIVSNIRILLNQ